MDDNTLILFAGIGCFLLIATAIGQLLKWRTASPNTVVDIYLNNNCRSFDAKNGTSKNFFQHNGLILINV